MYKFVIASITIVFGENNLWYISYFLLTACHTLRYVLNYYVFSLPRELFLLL